MSDLVEALGMACLVIAAWMFTPALGWAALGVALLVAGLALDGSSLGARRILRRALKHDGTDDAYTLDDVE